MRCRPDLIHLYFPQIALGFLAVCLGSSARPDAPALAPDEHPLDGAALYDHVRAASVEILIAGRQDGSGWFASDDGLVVTAAHVVWGHFGRDGDAHRVEVI